MSNSIERRKHHRIQVRWPITVLTDYGPIEGETRNIAVDGVSICCEEPLPLNQIFRMRVSPPHHRTMEFTGKVIWSDQYAFDEQNSVFGMGICLVKISDVDRHFFKDLVSAHP